MLNSLTAAVAHRPLSSLCDDSETKKNNKAARKQLKQAHKKAQRARLKQREQRLLQVLVGVHITNLEEAARPRGGTETESSPAAAPSRDRASSAPPALWHTERKEVKVEPEARMNSSLT